MGSATLIGLYLDIKPGAGLAGVEIVRVLKTPDNRIVVECCAAGEFRLAAAMIDGTHHNMELIQQIAEAMRARPAA